MRNRSKQLVRALLLSGATALIVPQAAMALTPACTRIDNQASVNYQIGGFSQPEIKSTDGSSNPLTSFFVAVKVDVLVQKKEATLPTSYPNATNGTVTYTVTNQGNATMGYDLTAANTATGTLNPFGGTPASDTFNATSINSTNGNLGTTGTIASLAPGASTDVPVVVTIPGTVTATDLTVLSLIAQSKFIGTGGGTVTGKNSTATGTQIGVTAACLAVGGTSLPVVAADVDGDGAGTDDGANDGKHIGYDALGITVGGLTITKTQAPYWDPINLTTLPKAIPGAVMTYTVTITNGATSPQATNVSVGDDLSGPIGSGYVKFGNYSGPGAIPTLLGFKDGTHDCTGSGANYGIVIDGVCKTNAFAPDDGGSFNDAADLVCGAANKVCASGITVNAGATKTVKYQVTIQ